MKLSDYLPQKAVADDLGVSLATLWRARNSDLPGFPKATIIRGRVFWKPSELQTLEHALLQFRGRSVFEEHRAHASRVQTLTKQRPSPKRRRRPPSPAQQELF